MGALERTRLGLRRRGWRLRAAGKALALRPLVRRTIGLRLDAILAFMTVRNEYVRLPYFLSYYRDLGVDHFLAVDNGSDDGTAEFLAEQPDVSVWQTHTSYKASRFGMDWMNFLLRRHGHGRWCLTVDADEFLVYPFCDTRDLRALTEWLDTGGMRSLGAMLLDMYPKGPIDAETYRAGQDPFEIAAWFDGANYMISKNYEFRNLWIQGGPRARVMFPDDPFHAPALNKIPLVKWHSRYVYASGTHSLLPRGLNLVYDHGGGEMPSGCLLHAKFLHTLVEKSREELQRRQHYADSLEFRAYQAGLESGQTLWTQWSERYAGWRQLDALGLMSRGDWA